MPRLPKLEPLHAGGAAPWLTRPKSTSDDDAQSYKSTGSANSDNDVTQMIKDFTASKDALQRSGRRTSFLTSILKGRNTTSDASQQRASGRTSSSGSRHASRSPEPANATYTWKLGDIYPIIPGKLHFTCAAPRAQPSRLLKTSSSLVVINSDLPKQYFSFCQDFGPNNLAIVLRFCEYLSARMAAVESSAIQLVFRASDEARIRTNSAFLLAAYLVIERNYTPEQAVAPFEAIQPYPFRGYRDATNAPVTFEISILDCLRGLVKAMSCGWFAPLSFNLPEYEHWDTPTNGDMHQVSPKFIAFKGPVDAHIEQGEYCHPPSHYIKPFRKKGVTAVIRLSEADAYDAKTFKSNGIHHFELFFEDCTTPTPAQVQDFINICDREAGLVAVHCKAGLGRTGTLIGAYMMKKHGFTAREAISWLRMCRPGCVIGPQQQFLVSLEEQMRCSSERSTPATPPGEGAGQGLYKREKLNWKLLPTSSSGSAGRSAPSTPPSSSDLAEQVSRGMVLRAKARDTSDLFAGGSGTRQSWPGSRGQSRRAGR